jgi:dipeptidase
VPDVAETASILGSQPWWLWGLEHGVNEHRVAIGNETVFAREPLGPTGLLGMDLVRLGLERGRTAAEALDAITGLIETHGQGGSGHVDVDWPYHNAFLIADPDDAWTLETSDRHWAARRVRDLGNVSNGLALAADWERGSADIAAFAEEKGWWSRDRGRLDFAAAYGDETGVPPNLCSERRRRIAALLAEGRGQITPTTVRAILRDHYESGPIHTPRAVDDPHFFSPCMHADPLDNTTAAMVAPLPRDPEATRAVWMCLGSPCIGAFLPCYPAARVPHVLARGTGDPDPESPWWRTRRLLDLVERDYARFAPRVRARWDALEETWAREAADVEANGPAALEAFMARTVTTWLAELDALVREVGAEA